MIDFVIIIVLSKCVLRFLQILSTLRYRSRFKISSQFVLKILWYTNSLIACWGAPLQGNEIPENLTQSDNNATICELESGKFFYIMDKSLIIGNISVIIDNYTNETKNVHLGTSNGVVINKITVNDTIFNNTEVEFLIEENKRNASVSLPADNIEINYRINMQSAIQLDNNTVVLVSDEDVDINLEMKLILFQVQGYHYAFTYFFTKRYYFMLKCGNSDDFVENWLIGNLYTGYIAERDKTHYNITCKLFVPHNHANIPFKAKNGCNDHLLHETFIYDEANGESDKSIEAHNSTLNKHNYTNNQENESDFLYKSDIVLFDSADNYANKYLVPNRESNAVAFSGTNKFAVEEPKSLQIIKDSADCNKGASEVINCEKSELSQDLYQKVEKNAEVENVFFNGGDREVLLSDDNINATELVTVIEYATPEFCIECTEIPRTNTNVTQLGTVIEHAIQEFCIECTEIPRTNTNVTQLVTVIEHATPEFCIECTEIPKTNTNVTQLVTVIEHVTPEFCIECTEIPRTSLQNANNITSAVTEKNSNIDSYELNLMINTVSLEGSELTETLYLDKNKTRLISKNISNDDTYTILMPIIYNSTIGNEVVNITNINETVTMTVSNTNIANETDNIFVKTSSNNQIHAGGVSARRIYNVVDKESDSQSAIFNSDHIAHTIKLNNDNKIIVGTFNENGTMIINDTSNLLFEVADTFNESGTMVTDDTSGDDGIINFSNVVQNYNVTSNYIHYDEKTVTANTFDNYITELVDTVLPKSTVEYDDLISPDAEFISNDKVKLLKGDKAVYHSLADKSTNNYLQNTSDIKVVSEMQNGVSSLERITLNSTNISEEFIVSNNLINISYSIQNIENIDAHVMPALVSNFTANNTKINYIFNNESTATISDQIQEHALFKQIISSRGLNNIDSTTANEVNKFNFVAVIDNSDETDAYDENWNDDIYNSSYNEQNESGAGFNANALNESEEINSSNDEGYYSKFSGTDLGSVHESFSPYLYANDNEEPNEDISSENYDEENYTFTNTIESNGILIETTSNFSSEIGNISTFNILECVDGPKLLCKIIGNNTEYEKFLTDNLTVSEPDFINKSVLPADVRTTLFFNDSVIMSYNTTDYNKMTSTETEIVTIPISSENSNFGVTSKNVADTSNISPIKTNALISTLSPTSENNSSSAFTLQDEALTAFEEDPINLTVHKDINVLNNTKSEDNGYKSDFNSTPRQSKLNLTTNFNSTTSTYIEVESPLETTDDLYKQLLSSITENGNYVTNGTQFTKCSNASIDSEAQLNKGLVLDAKCENKSEEPVISAFLSPINKLEMLSKLNNDSFKFSDTVFPSAIFTTDNSPIYQNDERVTTRTTDQSISMSSYSPSENNNLASTNYVTSENDEVQLEIDTATALNDNMIINIKNEMLTNNVALENSKDELEIDTVTIPTINMSININNEMLTNNVALEHVEGGLEIYAVPTPIENVNINNKMLTNNVVIENVKGGLEIDTVITSTENVGANPNNDMLTNYIAIENVRSDTASTSTENISVSPKEMLTKSIDLETVKRGVEIENINTERENKTLPPSNKTVNENTVTTNTEGKSNILCNESDILITSTERENHVIDASFTESVTYNVLFDTKKDEKTMISLFNQSGWSTKSYFTSNTAPVNDNDLKILDYAKDAISFPSKVPDLYQTTYMKSIITPEYDENIKSRNAPPFETENPFASNATRYIPSTENKNIIVNSNFRTPEGNAEFVENLWTRDITPESDIRLLLGTYVSIPTSKTGSGTKLEDQNASTLNINGSDVISSSQYNSTKNSPSNNYFEPNKVPMTSEPTETNPSHIDQEKELGFQESNNGLVYMMVDTLPSTTQVPTTNQIVNKDLYMMVDTLRSTTRVPTTKQIVNKELQYSTVVITPNQVTDVSVKNISNSRNDKYSFELYDYNITYDDLYEEYDTIPDDYNSETSVINNTILKSYTSDQSRTDQNSTRAVPDNSQYAGNSYFTEPKKKNSEDTASAITTDSLRLILPRESSQLNTSHSRESTTISIANNSEAYTFTSEDTNYQISASRASELTKNNTFENKTSTSGRDILRTTNNKSDTNSIVYRPLGQEVLTNVEDESTELNNALKNFNYYSTINPLEHRSEIYRDDAINVNSTLDSSTVKKITPSAHSGLRKRDHGSNSSISVFKRNAIQVVIFTAITIGIFLLFIL